MYSYIIWRRINTVLSPLIYTGMAGLLKFMVKPENAIE
jgi:hypothetical protein